MLAATVIFAAGCKKSSDDTTPTPSPTKSFSAKIDGTAWSSTSVISSYTATLGYTQVAATGGNNSDTFQITFVGEATGTFSMGTVTTGTASVNGTMFSSISLDPPVGQVVVTKYDKTSNLVSGTFSFDARDMNGATHHITEGKFENVPLVVTK